MAARKISELDQLLKTTESQWNHSNAALSMMQVAQLAEEMNERHLRTLALAWVRRFLISDDPQATEMTTCEEAAEKLPPE